jgi:hypothetical protein
MYAVLMTRDGAGRAVKAGACGLASKLPATGERMKLATFRMPAAERLRFPRYDILSAEGYGRPFSS